jgi:hypothetical protein
MEGTRHERAALVLASYVIGFITAFILYANVTSNNPSSFISAPTTGVNAASVANAVKPANVLRITVVNPIAVTYTNGRLEVVRGEDTNLLSFNPEVAGIAVDTTLLNQGFHFGEIKHKVSPDNSFVFFCERQDVTSTSCLGFVYDVTAGTIYPVVKNGAPVLISATSLATAELSNNGLTIGSNYSANRSAPWVLIDN